MPTPSGHYPPAGAGDFGRIQRKVLRFCHFDGNRLKFIEKLGAAEGLAADAEAAQHTGLIPHANLAQLDTGAENTGQVLHQGAEIHASVRSEEKDNFTAVKAIFHLDQLHIQPVVFHELLADPQSLFFPFPVFLNLFFVLFGGQAHQRTQGLDHRFVLDIGVGADADAVLQTLARFDNDAAALGNGQAGWVEIVLFSARTEPDADDFRHGKSSVTFKV